MRQGQITAFVLLGLLILIVLGFFLFLRQKTVQTQTQTSVDQLLNEFLEKNAIRQYVQNCLDTLSNHGALLLARQGGVLYQHQKSTTPHDPNALGVHYLPYPYEGQTYDAWYGIRDIEFHACPIPQEYPPAYPVPGRNVSALTLHHYLEQCQYYDRFSGYWGVNTLPKLCDPQGPNRIGITQTQGLYKSCEPGSYGIQRETTLQYQLQTYLQNHLPLCANFTVFEDAYGNRVETLQAPNVTVLWGDIDFTVTAQYPFRVQLRQKEPIVKYVEFTQENKLRLKKLYTYVNELVQHETQELFYAIEKDYNQAKNYEDLFTVQKIETPCNPCPLTSGSFDRLYLIRDERSKALGQTLTFLLPVRNRRPVLDVIPVYYDEPYRTKSYSKKVNASGKIIPVDIAAYNGTHLLVRPVAYDPDDDPLTYRYGAWKENQTSQVTNTACFDNSNPFTFTEGVYRFYNQDPNFCTLHTPAHISLWTASPEYQTTKQNAGYLVTNNDIGLHKVNVTVRDPEGLLDYQELNVLIIPEEYRNLTNTIP